MAEARAKKSARIFRARLEQYTGRFSCTVARLPFDATKLWPEMRLKRVRGTINGFEFRSVLLADEEGEHRLLMVYKFMVRAVRGRVGDMVEIELEPDLEVPEADIPEEFTRILKAEPDLRKWFNRLTKSDKRSVGYFVGQAKSAETREKRAEQMAEQLMLTMEGEIESPPLLKMAFQRQPLAGEGWRLMTANQRRRHLMSIYYYRTPEGREKRARAVIDEAIARAKKARPGNSKSKVSQKSELADGS
ncbi:MAG TPA: YdeI/OmpD-associated family protein [Terracidiphilus sp.]|jgi:uncharacterized protein YdeI (YjbR/CyaY-like superfamily)